MSTLDQAIETQLKNIEIKAGKPRGELKSLLRATGLTKHTELREHAQSTFGLGHGDANALVHFACASSGTFAFEGKSDDAVLDEIYTSAKAALRPLHEALLAHLSSFGEFEIAPKKGYVSLRRRKQFAMVGPTTNTRIEVGINHKALPGTERLLAQPAGGMCTHKIKLTDVSEIDDELLTWIRSAYDSAG